MIRGGSVYRRLVTDCVSMISMKPEKNKGLNKSYLFKIGHLILSLMLFQCAPNGSGILGQTPTETLSVDPKIQQAPFAYDAALDTISHLSCNNFYGNTDLFGFKVGSSEGFSDTAGTGAVKAGLKLRSDFLQYVGQNFSPNYPNTTIQPDQILEILNDQGSVLNLSPQIQTGIRKRTDLTAVADITVKAAGSPAEFDLDVALLNPILGAGYLGYSLAKSIQYTTNGNVLAEGPRIYNLSNNSTPSNLEMTLKFNELGDNTQTQPLQNMATTEANYMYAEAGGQKVRDLFNSNTNILTLAYTGPNGVAPTSTAPSSPTPVVSTGADNLIRPLLPNSLSMDTTKAFGRGYYLKFNRDPSSPTTNQKNLLTNVNEFNLDSGSPASGVSWTCESFVVVQNKDYNSNFVYDSGRYKNGDLDYLPNCMPIKADDIDCVSMGTTPLQCSRYNQLKKIRRHFSAEKWNVGILYTGSLKGATTPNYPPTTQIGRNSLTQLCIAPIETNTTCYLPTSGVMSVTSGTGTTTQLPEDIGIQYDKTQPCYLSSYDYGTTERNTVMQQGRCAQYASICTRTTSGF